MSKLTDLYEAKKTPFEDQILSEKNLLIVVPEKKHDIGPLLAEIGITPFEVSVTWPKKSLPLDEEIDALESKLVIQLDCKLTEKAISLESGVPDPIKNDIRDAVPEITADTFVGLHHHDEFSIKDGLGVVGYFDARQKRWTGLIGLLKAQRRSFCSITNHGSVGGWVKQYNACKKAGVKAIFGMEAYVSNYRGDDPEQRKANRSANHLVLIANTEEGFFNIIRIHNDAQLNGFYYTPRVNREALEKWGKGIVASSACMAGELARFLMEDKQAEAKEAWEFYNRVFDAFYVEIQIIESEDQREANRRLIQFARSVGAPLVLTCDSHYLDSEYSETHDILMLLRQKKTVMDKMEKDDVWSFDVRNLHYRDAAGMRQVFENGFTNDQGEHAPFKDDIFTEEVFVEAMDNTLKIARGTAVITLDSKIKLPKLYDNGKEVLRKKVNEGFAARGLIQKENRDDYLKRIKHEFDVITRTGWGDYFLVMDRIVADTEAQFGEWAIGYGRGSAAGSLVSYCLGLTKVDPIEYGLLFERFLEEGRPDPPDIDTDFDPRYREWVKKHIVEVFGTNKVCSIGTYATYKTRAVILDVARALGENLVEVMAVTKRIEPLRAFEDEEGEEQKVDQMAFDDLCEHYPELKAYFEAHPEVRRHSEILRNQVKNMGTHAGGVIISDLDLQDRIPVCKDKNGQVISTWGESGSVQELSAVGLVKYDILGLNNLPVISDCVKMIEKTTGHHIARADIPISDRESIYLGSKRDLVGIFQFENPVTKPIADAVGMESLEDVAAITSLIRPGPMDADIDGVRMPLEYARRKHGGVFESPEFIKKALSSTYSLIVYQEDVMRISRVLSGFTAPESNKLRKAAGKKIRELMVSIKEKFIAGAKTRIDAGEITSEEVVKIWEQIETFAGYGFNKSHAVTYGAITTVELWLKHNFPIQYIAALVNNTKLGKKKHGSNNILVDYLNYARRREIPVMGPDINMSGDEFRVEEDGIRFALGTIKNVSKAAALIESFQPFTSMEDFYERVRIEDGKIPDDAKEPEESDEEAGEEPPIVDEADEGEETPEQKEEFKKTVIEEIAKIGQSDKKPAAKRPNRKVIESLIAAGAFDRFGTRNEMAMAYWRLRKKSTKKEKLAEKAEIANNKHSEAVVAFTLAAASGDAKAIKKSGTAIAKAELALQKARTALSEEEKMEAAIAAIPREDRPKKNQDDMPPDDIPLEKWQDMEAEVLGMCLSRPILYKEYETRIREEGWYLINEIDPDRKKVQVFGQITNVAQHISKAGNSMHIVYMTDGIDTMRFFVFQGGWDFFRDHYKVGTIGVVPMARFDDGDGSTRFFDDRGQWTIIKKG